tara:strand:- start:24 stop:419 length:396 start_codon:yes stop_codon:yes gene_type:complete
MKEDFFDEHFVFGVVGFKKKEKQMDYKTNNDKHIITDGSCLRGGIDCSYKTLFDIFGKPSELYDDYKSDAEWQVEFPDGMVATIYNYKDGVNYNGEDGIPTEKLTDWHIGGKDRLCVDRIKSIINKERINK